MIAKQTSKNDHNTWKIKEKKSEIMSDVQQTIKSQ